MALAWTPITVIAPKALISRCGIFGRDIAPAYAERTWSKRQLKNTAEMQGLSKLCECMACLACGVDPDSLDWEIDRRKDPGWDFMLGNLKVDAKGTWVEQAKYLIYPVWSTPKFDAQDVDLFLMVWAAKPKTKNWGYGEVRGWQFKDQYKLNRRVVTKADWTRYRMRAGTWALHQDYLLPMGTLVGGNWRDADDLRGKVFGGTAPTA